MPISSMRRQAEILSRCAEASYWMATRSGEDGRAIRIRAAASLIEEVASAMRASATVAHGDEVPADRAPVDRGPFNIHPLRRRLRG